MDECLEDRFAPEFQTDIFLASTNNTWFTRFQTLLAIISGTVIATDDCGMVHFSPPILTPDCQSSTVLLSATDRCDNRANTTVSVLFDDQPPQIAFSLAPLSFPDQIFTRDPLVFKGEVQEGYVS